ncbi:hypothetical protein ZIOFF_072919 [Zingiber officinale]|uniref:ATP-dependent DNA helicase RecQ zinc-binding domain-containing protein n=1 Tax=Zingiber officinale TaxID=94328 RepID=A0A8J5C6E5_ZINOF|nr:hypothetical protein ZIOFF_072919 [Zingiber officinale]
MKKRESSPPSGGLLEKSVATFTQMVEYYEGSGCHRGGILQSFGEQVSTYLCQKSCDSCKQPIIVVQHLKDLEGKTYSQKDKFFPILTKSFKLDAKDMSCGRLMRGFIIPNKAAQFLAIRGFAAGGKAKKASKGGDAPKATGLSKEVKSTTVYGANILKEGGAPKFCQTQSIQIGCGIY